MATKVTVSGVRELAAAALALRTVDRELRAQTAKHVRAALPAVWSPDTVTRHARTRMDRAVLSTTAARSTSKGFTLSAGGGRTLGREFDLAHAIEFGTTRQQQYETYGVLKPTRHTVTRRTRAHLPPRVRKGRVVHPAAASVLPRVASLYVQTVVRTLHEAWEGKRG